MVEPFTIDPAALWGGAVAIGGFFAWLIRYLLQDLKTVVSSNTEALNQIKITLEKCKFIQSLEKKESA